jgi:hypothetical protein
VRAVIAPAGARPLAVARVALGAVLVVRTTALANLLPIPLAHVRGPLFGWPEHGAPFAWLGLALPDGVKIGAAVLRTIAALLFFAGVRARIAGVAAALLGWVALSQDPFGFVFTLHTLFLGTIVLALGDATSELALVPDRPYDAASSARLLRTVLAAIYGWSAIAKLHGEWLRGDTLRALAEDRLVTPLVRDPLLASGALRVATAWGVLAIEIVLAAAIVSAHARRRVLAGALAFHLALEVAARPDVMGFVMASLVVGAAWTPRQARSAR